MKERVKVFGIIIAILVSSYNLYDLNFHSSNTVIAGRQIRLFAAYEEFRKDSNQLQPCIFMTLSFTNDGGKANHITDIKLNVTWLVDQRVKLAREFKAGAEIDNFFLASGLYEADPISPIVILGKSTEIRQYGFLPFEPIRQNDIPLTFDLRIDIYTKKKQDWQYQRSYCQGKIEMSYS